MKNSRNIFIIGLANFIGVWLLTTIGPMPSTPAVSPTPQTTITPSPTPIVTPTPIIKIIKRIVKVMVTSAPQPQEQTVSDAAPAPQTPQENAPAPTAAPTAAPAADPLAGRCIITIDGGRYDVTDFRNIHSGGDVFSCGADMSAVFHNRHPNSFLNAMAKYKV